MGNRLRVAVLMGGISPEHPVSLVSGCGILANLDPDRWAGFPVLISRDNRWLWPESGEWPRAPRLEPSRVEEIFRQCPAGWVEAPFPRFAKLPEADVYFLGLHGVGGEDGRLQGFLELAGIPFTGSGLVGSALAMDKILAKEAYAHHGIPTPAWVTLEAEEFDAAGAEKVEKTLGLPAVIKHPLGGSSLGVALAKDRDSLLQAIGDLGRQAPRLLAEAYMPGREATCGVLAGAGDLPPTEIRAHKDAFFNYEAKYEIGRAAEITPAPFPAEILAEIQSLARRCHAALRLSVYSRSDFIWNDQGIFALESNSLPGFTPNSLLPQAAAHFGIGYRDLLTRILEESLRRWPA